MSVHTPTQYNDAEDFRAIDLSRAHGWWILSESTRRQYKNTFFLSDIWEVCMRPSCGKNFYPTSDNTYWYCDKCCHDLIIQRSIRCSIMLQEQQKEEEA